MAELQKTLSFKVLLLITINSILGTGVFFLPAIGARVAGPASIISWVIISLISIYTAACFGELVGMYPTSGGIYEYTKRVFGHFVSFIVGWVAWLIGNITTSMLIVGAITYLFPINTGTTLFFKIGASIFWILILNYMTFRGLKTSAVMLVSFAIVTLLVILSLIIPGWVDLGALIHGSFITHINPHNLFPFFIKKGLSNNLLAIIVAAFLISETFFGVESVCFLAGETKNPEKVLPKVLITAMVIISGIVILLVFTSLLIVPWKLFSGLESLTGVAANLFGTTLQAPYAYVAWLFFGDIGRYLFTLGTYLVIIGAAAGWVVTTPRLILSMAEDKLFPHQLAAIHRRYATPYKAIFFQTIISVLFVLVALLGGASGYERLLELLIPLVLLLMAFIVLLVPILRRRDPGRERPFKAPFPRYGPIVLSLFYVALTALWFLNNSTHALSIVRLSISFVLFGIPIFLLLMLYYNPEAIVIVNEKLAFFNLLLEDFLLPKRIRHEILSLFKHLQDRKVLEFGAGVGTLTLQLAEKVGKNGRIIATDLSRGNLRFLEQRLAKRKINHVTTLHDPHQVNRVHPAIKEVDVVFSVGMLSYIQDLQKVLREIHAILPEHGKICFVEYVDYFRFLPNPKWLDDAETLKQLFREAGFSVQVVKLKGLFWNYLFVYGVKSQHALKGVPYI